MIRRADGRPYKLKGSLQQFDPQDLGHDLFNRYDEEIIKIGGSPIYYYEALIQMNTVDPVYFEDRGKLFSPCYVQLWAYYEPPQQQNESSLFGIDTPNEEIVLELNYQAVLRDLGHPPKIGSRVYTPHRGENWIVIDYKLDQFKMWGAIRLQLHCRKFTETASNNDGMVTQCKPPDYQFPT